jgi:hypothetical protein
MKTHKGSTAKGIDYLFGILKDKKTVVSRVAFWKIPHSHEDNDVRLKIGRYKKVTGFSNSNEEIPEVSDPKSALTLDKEEFHNLIEFLQYNYEPFEKGVKKFIPVDNTFNNEEISNLQAIFANPEKSELMDFIIENEILPTDLIIGLQNIHKVNAVKEFDRMLNDNLVEHKWQEWFEQNDWVLGSEFVRILDERVIDTSNISDFLMEAYDGFLDIIEIKRPEGNLKFWMDKKDHDNLVPSTDLIKAITQASKYIYEVEREANSNKFLEKVDFVKTIKPRCVLIFGRSNDWNQENKEAYRILNSEFHNLTILTYDHVLNRAKRILNIEKPAHNNGEQA